MAVMMASQFSEDGKYFAHLSTDGKLKIWNTSSNTFEQEFTPDFHLTSPCTCLHFVQSDCISNKGASPKKKKRRESDSNFCPRIVLGTTSGLLLVYSVSKATVEYTINSETNQSINCLSLVDNNLVYSGVEQNIFVWSLGKRKIFQKWKGGNEKITAILVLSNSRQILTASKTIKLWNVDEKEVLRIFTGHSSDVTFLHCVNPKETGDAYFISGSKDDRLLSCWNISDNSQNKNAVASFLMDDIVQSISIYIANDGSTNMAATVRSGVVHVYRHTLNGKCSKPFKPITTIQVVSDAGQSDQLVTPIKIVGAVYRDDETLCIGYGSEILLTFENIELVYSKKIQCLIRKDPKKMTVSQEDQVSKTVNPVISNDVHYLTSQTSSVSRSKRKNEGKLEVPMEQRLENLTLNKLDGCSKVPQVNNVAQLLVQGLHSKDKNILKTVLYKKEEDIIKNTVKRLPINVIVPFIQELSTFVQGKTLSSQIGALWLKHILQIHAGILMSNPELPDLLGSILGNIENRLALLTPLNRLKGRLDLLMSQVITGSSKESIENEEPLLIYNDKDSSDSGEDDLQMDAHSESENEWEEESNDGAQVNENNADSESNSEMST